MSLFASLGQSDLFSRDFFAPSPLFDLLERGEYTLEELLAEDELLQEVKSKNDQLTEFLCSEEQVSKLIRYITQEPADTEDELHQFKYPYMSCEVLCCEVPEMMDVVVERDNGKFLDQLFAILEPDTPINHYLAGYFEKVLEVLFRRKTIKLMAYLNEKGLPLLKLFLKHIDNYSVMQIVQRLLLPHIPFSMETADLEVVPPEDHDNCQCNWSYLPETADLLTARMLDAKGKDVPYHVSDLLITVVQLSAPDAPFLGHLCEEKNLVQLLEAAFMDVPEESSAAADVSLASISVLESLISRLCETSNPFEAMQMGGPGQDDAPHEKSSTQLAAIQSVSGLLVQHIAKLQSQLQRYVQSDPLGSITLQMKESIPRLGQKGLQLVKLVEATVRLGVPELDRALCKTGALAACLDLFFKYQLNSLLHLSVQRIVLMILEGGQARRQTQRHLLVGCKLLARVLEMLQKRQQLQAEEPKRRHPIFGHLIVISQIIVTVKHQETANEPPPLPPRHTVPSDSESEVRSTVAEPSESDSIRSSASDSLAHNVVERAPSFEVEDDVTTSAHFRDIMVETGVQEAWNKFVEGDFTEIMTAQTAHLGGGSSSMGMNDYHDQHLDSMGVGLDLNGIGFQDRADLTDLEQGMPEWLPGATTMALSDADGDLLAVAQGSLSMYHADDNDSAGSDDATAQDAHHGSDDSDDDHSDDEAGTPNAASTAALGQTLFFASFDQAPSDLPAPFEAFADFPAPSETSGPVPFEAFASFPNDTTSTTTPTDQDGEQHESGPQRDAEPAAEATSATPADNDPFAAPVDMLSVLANEEASEGSSSQ